MELSLSEIALIQIACRAMLENALHQKDRDAYQSLLCRLTVVIKGKKLKIQLVGEKDNMTVRIPQSCMEIGGGKDNGKA